MIHSRKRIPTALAAAVLVAPLACAPASYAAQPSAATTQAYNDYLRQAESRMLDDYLPGGVFLSADLLNQANAPAQLVAGRVLIRCVAGCDSSGVHVPGGLIHDWAGVVFIPGVSLPEVLGFVEDYNHAAAHYAPNVIESRLLSRSGNSFRVFLRLKQTQIISVLFDTDYDIHYVQLDAARAYSISHSTRIAQLAGGSQDRELPPADEDGFLWRLDTYWRFEQANGGVYVQCRAISLSRAIPRGLAWIVAPFIKDIPRKSLQFTLNATRATLLQNKSRSLTLIPAKPAGLGSG